MQLIKVVAAIVVMVALTLAGCGGGGGGGETTPAPVSDTTAPTVSITTPLNSAVVTGNTTVSASAADAVGVTRVEFYLNGVLKGTATSAPYAVTMDTSSLVRGGYTLAAKAYDAANNVGQSADVAVTVPISVSMSTVINGTTAVGTVRLSGVAVGEAFGLSVNVSGGQIASAVQSGTAASASSPAVIGSTIILPSSVGFGPGEVMKINFDNVPTPANLQISLAAVLDSSFNQIQ